MKKKKEKPTMTEAIVKSDPGVFTPETVTNESTALVKSVQGLVAMTKSKASIKRTLADDHARTLLTTALTTFVAVDCQFDNGMKKMGEICTNILNQDKNEQIAIIKALCDAQGIPMIEYNEKAPRGSLARALFARFPDMQETVQGGKDTKGALRITSYTTAYKNSKAPARRLNGGTTETTETETTTVGKIRTAKELFQRLYLGATMKERDQLTALAGKLGIQFESWISGTEQPANS